jgi:biopolymer transport protein ExbD
MRRANISSPEEEARNEVNLTPMLDVVFIMLIFFIVTASFVKEVGLDVNRSDVNPNPDQDNESILIAIAKNSDIWMDGRLIDPRAVRANIERMHSDNPTATVVIQANKSSANKTLVQVMDASRQAGIYSIALAAEEG